MDADRILAFRLARSGLAVRKAPALSDAAACPASDFSRDAALLALAARHEGTTRTAFDDAVDRGDLVVAQIIRGAIHALAPGDFALWGRALIATGDDELAAQLGRQVRQLAADTDIAPTDALEEVAEATTDALQGGRTLAKNELHEALRERVNADLMPWCKGCHSHHVAPMLWRYAAVKAGARFDSARRYVLGDPRPSPPAAARAVERYLHFYGPGDPKSFAEWAGVAGSHATRLWAEVEDRLAEVAVGGRRAWALRKDLPELESPPDARGVRLLPPGDPYLQKPNRPLVAPEDDLRKRLFRPVASPGAVLARGKLAGLWRAKAKGRKIEVAVERLRPIPLEELEEESRRLAELRGASDFALRVD